MRLGIDCRQECGSALYQVDALVKFSSSEKVSFNPQLFASSSGNCSIVVADTTVVLFDQNFQSVLLHLYFGTEVDVAGVCQKGHFLLVGERNGNLHLVYVPQKRTVLTRAVLQKIPCDNEKSFRSLIIQEDKATPGLYHLFVIASDGFIHISNLQLDKIQKAIEKMDLEALKELQSVIKTVFSSTADIHTQGCHSALTADLANEIHLIIGGSGENVLTQWKMDSVEKTTSLTNLLDSSLIPGVRKIQVMENLMYVLNEENVLSIWEVNFLVMVSCWSELQIHDFLLTTEGETASAAMQEGTSVRLIALTMQCKQMSLLVYSVPAMTVLYSLEVSATSSLVQTGINTDTIYLLEGISENPDSSEGPASVLVLRCLTEALPENRFSRLLHKHKFEEAEKFAVQFGLDVELVYKVKLDFVLEKLASTSVKSSGHAVWSELVNEVKTNLMKIMDEQFVVEYCMQAPWPTFSIAEEMLNHAASRYPSSQIQGALSRLVTFCGLNGPDKFNGISWIEFLNRADYMSDVLWHLREGDLKGAQHLWLRHEWEFAEKFDEKVLDTLLCSIPENIPSKELCLWFKSVIIPFIRRTFPKGQKTLARWLEQRARNLQLTEKSDWPQNGLDLAELGLPSFWLCMPPEDYGAEEVEKLKSLVGSLRELLDLYRKYNCRLSLSDFEKGNTRSIAFLMLDKVLAPELIPSVMESTIRPYALAHHLPLDELLLLYIKDLLDRCSSQSTSLFTEWEAKAMAVLGCMTDTDLVVDAVLEIMYKAVVPWSEAVEQLVQQHLEMEHPKQELLRESYQLMEMKKLLRGYGIRNFSLSNNCQVMILVRYILKQDLPTSLEDALKVAQAYKLHPSQINFLYFIQLVGQAKKEECMMLVKQLPPEEAEFLIERLAAWAQLELQDEAHVSEEHKVHQMVVAQVMVEALKFLQSIQKDNAFKSIECENNLKMFKAIAHLQEDFDIFLKPEDYTNTALRAQFQEQLVTAYQNARARGRLKSAANDANGKVKTMAKLHQLARQLQCCEQELWASLAVRALGVGKVEEALKICSELYQHHCNPRTGRVLFSAAHKLCQMLEENVPMILPEGINLPAVIHELACQAATVCHPDLLLDCVELCKSTSVAVDVYRQCQIDNYGFTAKDSSLMADRDPYTEWSFQDIFNEDGLVMDPVLVLPSQYEITSSLLPSSSDSKMYPLDCSCLSSCSYVEGSDVLKPLSAPVAMMLQNLQECSQLELALRLLLNTFGSSLQHVISNSMDLTLSSQLHDHQRLSADRKCLSEREKLTTVAIKSIAIALLHKVLNWRVVDCDLAIGYCTLLPKKDVFEMLWKVINNTWQNYDKILAVAMVGAHLSSLYKEEQQHQKFSALITDAEWGIKLSKLGISIQPVFRQCAEMKKDLIPTLVKNRNMTPELILQYCSTFDLDGDAALNLYITTLLLQEEPDEELGGDEGGAGEPGAGHGKALGHADALERALQIIPQLRSTAELVISLSAAILKLSPYNYERIEGILKIIQTADEKITSLPLEQAAGLLQHLKSYKRISPPTDLESSYMLENSLEPTPLANTRLPFHLLLQTNRYFWKIISPELSEETFPTLLLISKLMKVSLDKLYMSAVYHVFDKSLKPQLLEQAKRGHCHAPSKEVARMAKTIMDYVLCIKNPEWAAATAHKIAQEIPPGIEKTRSLMFCLALGDKWLKLPNLEEEARAKAEVFMEKLKLQYQRSATENALMSSELSSPELQKLTGNPIRLIVALFEHSSVEQRIRSPLGLSHPDIHAVAKEIAGINSVELSKVRDMLLEKWLCKTGPSAVTEMNFKGCATDIQEDPDLMRVVYLLQMYPMDFSARLLSTILTADKWPLNRSGPRLTFLHRSRALLCLSHIADPPTLETLLHIDRTKVQDHLKCYIYLSQLEALNIPYTVESFLSSPKEGLIKGLWKNHSHEPQAVSLVADLSLEYQVFDPQLWNGVLQNLLGFSMISYLQKVLEALGAVPSLWQVSNFSRTWRSVILAPFMSASLPLSSEQLATLYKTFVLLLKCPFLLNLDLIGIAKRFDQCGLPAFSLGSLLLIPYTQKKDQQIKNFLTSCNVLTVLEQVEDHMNTGELAGIPSQIKETVLTFVCENGHYDKLVKTKYFPLLRQHIALCGHHNQVKDLVNYLTSRNCNEDATALAREYQRHRAQKEGKNVPLKSAAPDIMKEFLGEENGFSG
ncbi:hypothetical protein MATL_G00062040 [Megalops atlanticus]|uniref:Kinetochore-associated protein 1 n=1 Tax=Megalops atlanticus TaxID=7932 RepID=A0A9D3Q744_MEGAT|nr:hypothetical protein MATL_G00062040 [Megalops atlanticus]